MLVEIQGLRGGYGGEDIVKGISCAVDAGEVLSVVGPNGCGKTTLFRLILGSLTPTGGGIYIDGLRTAELPPKKMARLIAYIPQHHSPVFTYTVLEIVMMGRASHFSALEAPKPVDREAAFDALEKLDIAHFATRKYTSLSGGQRQLVLIARAICQEARVFVMDEPGASLDFANHQLLMNVVEDLAQQGYAIILSSHSPEHPFSIGHRVMLMQAGRVAALGQPEEAITAELLEQVYGIEMDIFSVHDRYGKRRTLCLPVNAPAPKKEGNAYA